MKARTLKSKSSSSSRVGILAIVAAIAALSMVFGMAFAWADEDVAEESFESIGDIPDQSVNGEQETAVVDVGATANADVEGDAQTSSIPAFDKKEITVELGSAYLVGFAPEAADDDSEDEARAEWHKNWKKAVEDAKVDLTDESGWLVAEDADGNPINYDAITGIIVEDKEIFELLGEFPEWKVDDEGVEYRWWYGLLGVAKKEGETKLLIVHRDDEGVNQVLGECVVHVKAAENEEADSVQDDEAAESEVADESNKVDEAADDASSASTAGDSADMTSQSSTGVTISTAAADSSQSASATGSSGSASSASASNSSQSSSTSTSTAAAYPKEMFATLQGSSISATLLANDAATEDALNKLANGATLHLAVEAKSALGTEAEKSLTTISSNNGVSIAERLSVKVLDANNSEATISGMNLTVKIAADNAIKALDASSVQVWYVAEDGTTEKMNAKLSGGYLTFETKHLSDFVVMGKAGSSTSSSTTNGKSGLPQTGDPMAYLAITLAFVAGFSASSALNARRRMKE